MPYNWQLDDWPEFRYDPEALRAELLRVHERAARSAGALSSLSTDNRDTALLEILATEAIESAQIEGENLNLLEVRSSVQRQLGLQPDLARPRDPRAQGAAELVLMARAELAAPLSESMLFDWHRTLMQGRSGVLIGAWRTHVEPMQIVSGSTRPRIHFEAPPSARVPAEMHRFIEWFNRSAPGGASEIAMAPIRAAIAHLHFESIHPFEDGNGRIGRALAERALSQTLGHAALLALSKAIERRRRDYYDALEAAQRSNEITPWLRYFVQTIREAQDMTEVWIRFVIHKTQLLQRLEAQLNERQRRAVLRMLEAGPEGFTGGMTAQKYMAITKSSKATATRDLAELVRLGAVRAIGAGRGSRYELRLGS